VNIVRRNCRLFQHHRPEADIGLGPSNKIKLAIRKNQEFLQDCQQAGGYDKRSLTEALIQKEENLNGSSAG